MTTTVSALSSSGDLVLDRITASVGERTLLHDVSLRIAPGEVHALLGANGSGKSSLAAVVAGHPAWHVQGGRIVCCGQDWVHRPAHERALDGLYLAPQRSVEFPGVPTLTFLRETVNAHRTFRGEPPIEAIDMVDRCRRLAKQVGLPEAHLQSAFNVGFSGGETKRLELLQILLLEPRWLILDELDAGMDVEALRTTVDLLTVLFNKQRSIMIISHQTRLLEALPVTAVHVMHQGKLVHHGGNDLVDRLQTQGFDNFLTSLVATEAP